MKKIIKYTLIGCCAFFCLKNIPQAASQFELVKDPNQLSYMIEKGPHKFQLYFHLIRDSETHEYIYCLEPGVALSNETYEELNEWEYSKLNLTEEEKNFIVKVAYYGFNDSNHNHLNYYYAAQLLIWQKLIPNDWKIYFTNHLGGEKITPFVKEQQEILDLVKEDEILPSFANHTYEWLKKDPLSLTDTTNTLEKYELINPKNAKIVKAENTLQISNLQSEEITLEFEKKYFGKPLKFYYHANGQNILKKGAMRSQQFKLYLKPYETEVKIQKIDEFQKAITGVEFTLYPKNKPEEKQKFTTNENGEILISNLDLGEYCLKESFTPNEYIANVTPKCFQLTKEEKNILLTIQNEHKKTNLILQKEDAETKERLPMVRFQLWQAENCVFDGYTNELGLLEIPDLLIGKYLLKEIETLDHYILEKEPKEIVITGEEQEITITIINHPLEKVPNTLEVTSHPGITLICYEERKKRR